jgi:hypothetical protein
MGQESEMKRKKAGNLQGRLQVMLQVTVFHSFLLGLLTHEDGTDMLSQNVGEQLLHNAS